MTIPLHPHQYSIGPFKLRNLGYRPFFEDRPPETLANLALCLIHQANYLLDRQIRRLEKDFVAKGGLRERMTRAHLEHRKK